MKHSIVKTESTPDGVTITLANGVVVCLSSNDGYVHLHFSGIVLTQDSLVATSCHAMNGDRMKLANYVDLVYSPRKP